MITDSDHYAGRHDQHIVEGCGEMTDRLVMYPPERIAMSGIYPDADRPAQGSATPGRLCHRQLETPSPCGSPSA